MSVLKGRIGELEGIVKRRESQISELENNSESLKNKISGFDNHFEEIQYLKKKISEYEHKVSSLSFKPASRSPNTEPTQIFERKVIYQLKLENEALRQRLGINGQTNGSGSARGKEGQVDVKAVSYTHLTLPTIYSV